MDTAENSKGIAEAKLQVLMSEIAWHRQLRRHSPLDMVDCARMLSFDDERWNHLKGGYKTPFDPRPSLRKLESQQDAATAWQELWEEGTLGTHHTPLYRNS
jgi:hypothetical protein